MPDKNDTLIDYDEKLHWQKSHPQLEISYNLDYDPNSIWEIPGVSEDVRKLPFYVQEIGLTIAHDKYYVERSGLASYMICYITSGSMILSYGGNTTVLNPDTMFWINCLNPHTIALPDHIHEMECYFVHFYGTGADLYKEYFDSLNKEGILQLESDNPVLSYMKQLLHRYTKQKRSIMTDLEASNLLSNVCYSLVEEVRSRAKENIPQSIGEIRDFIADHYNSQITLKTLSDKFFISEAYLQKQFKKYVGESPLEFLTQERIAESKKLLRTTNLSVHEIAYQVGFNDPSYFVQVFKHREDITPLKYKKLWTSSTTDSSFFV